MSTGAIGHGPETAVTFTQGFFHADAVGDVLAGAQDTGECTIGILDDRVVPEYGLALSGSGKTSFVWGTRISELPFRRPPGNRQLSARNSSGRQVSNQFLPIR
jgi:hypothetical protein